jgi:hypothetical protein
MILCFNTFQIACPDRTTRPCGNSQRDIPMFGHICVIRHSAEWIFNLLLHLFYGWRVICTRPSINCIHLLNTPPNSLLVKYEWCLVQNILPVQNGATNTKLLLVVMCCSVIGAQLIGIPECYAICFLVVCCLLIEWLLLLLGRFLLLWFWSQLFAFLASGWNSLTLSYWFMWRCNALGTSVFIMLNAHAACQEYCA